MDEPFDDATLVVETLLEIRHNVRRIIGLLEELKMRVTTTLTRRLEAAIARRKAESARRAAGESA